MHPVFKEDLEKTCINKHFINAQGLINICSL